MGVIRLLLIVVLAPILGMIFSLSQQEPMELLGSNNQELVLDFSQVTVQTELVSEQNNSILNSVGLVRLSLEQQQEQYAKQQELIQQLIADSLAQKELSNELYEQQLFAKLGKARDEYKSAQVELLLFDVKEANYRGYLAKLKLRDPQAIRVLLGQDTYGKLETTQQATNRSGAIFGVNGGGFFQVNQAGSSTYLPLGNTIVDSQLAGNFSPSRDDLFFAGFNHQGNLVGGQYTQLDQLLAIHPLAGVSFVPILMEERLPVTIPTKWRNARHPRTVVGSFANGDIFFLVIDGRQPNWSRGATLEEVQLKLLQWGAVNAYNLDGGGSSTMVFQGELVNRPSEGRQRPVATNILIMP